MKAHPPEPPQRTILRGVGEGIHEALGIVFWVLLVLWGLWHLALFAWNAAF